MTAFMFAPLGLGGGVLYVPIFLFLLEWDIYPSLVASLILVWMVSLGSRAAHAKGGYAIASVGKRGTNAALMGAVFGAVLASIFINQLGDMSIKISATFLLIWVLYSTIKKLNSDLHDNGDSDNHSPDVEGKILNIYRAGCFGGGAASGLLGIGGGAIFVTLHRSTLKYKQHQAAGTSYIIAGTQLIIPSFFSCVYYGAASRITVPLTISISFWYVSSLFSLSVHCSRNSCIR